MTAKTAAAAARATVYGYPRQVPNRELKKAVEGYWKGRVTADALRRTAADLRRSTWQQLADTGIHEVPTGDFSYYDHVLDTSVMVGAVPQRHRAAVGADALDGYFAMARGTQDVAPLEMTKWFDTNYHYLVPELGPETVFTTDSTKQVGEFKEAIALGLAARPVLVGPVTYLLLAKPAPGVAADFEPLTLLDRLLPVYAEVLADLHAAGADWVQLDEPALVQDRSPAELNAAADRPAYLDWATEAFRLTTGGVRPDTQIHTHMCYAEFGDIVQAIDDLDADVISLEAARSHMQVARELAAHGYPREAGPGVYDIHSPRVPSAEEAAALLRKGLEAIPAGRLWVNPDCGLKTRGWPETRASLENLVSAARTVRSELPHS
ncbi:hypothetical protein [Streptomyces sp. NRRL S-1824]|uniref:hypothetical protein n=1 Tax=Streptomyces sp. NRRL S-1824 TaxID=1463889 RepID=UPI0004CA9584|nr:hypothetical protein [Streptomyces sp. NRRL S-1824]